MECSSELNIVVFLVGIVVATFGTIVLVKITVFKERKVHFSDGVKKIEVDLKSKSGKVTYKASLIDLNTIENAITSIGYNVNGKVADPVAYQKLEICCKKPEDVDLD